MKVGAIVPLTGDLQSFGEAGNAALELATEVANDALAEAGYKGKVELLVEDGETKEDAAIAAAEKLVGEDVSCIIGDWASSSTEAVAQSVTIDEGVPLISPASTAGSITTLEDDGTVRPRPPQEYALSARDASCVEGVLRGTTLDPAPPRAIPYDIRVEVGR